MTTLTFDTLKFANRLKAAGMESRQAEAMAEAQAEIYESNLKDLVTRETLRQELTMLEQRLTIRLGTIIVGVAGIVIAFLRFFPPGH